MRVFDTIKSLQEALAASQIQGRQSLGFVPTMGALHKGHLSLVAKAKKENGLVVVSIFVNPTQFNNPDDLKNYPRTLEADLKLLEPYQPDFIFAPTVEEMYPAIALPEIQVHLGPLELCMEGKHRPGHFKGVVQVVARLFDIVKPDMAYFGQKDFQQLAVIREMTRQLELPVRVGSGETIREADGLAMSSRNVLLNPEQRLAASQISRALFFVRDNWQQFSIKDLCAEAISRIEANPLMKVEYLEIADSDTLQTLFDWSQSSSPRVFTAVQIGKVRLIDNVALNTTHA